MISKKVNIPKTVVDAHYRYQRPLLEVTTSGKGYRLKTELTNLTTVAKSLERPPKMLARYFSLKKCVRIFFINRKYSLAGSHSVEELELILENFIKKGILCQKCANPETLVRGLRFVCKACGYSWGCQDDDITGGERKGHQKIQKKKNKIPQKLDDYVTSAVQDHITFTSALDGEAMIKRQLDLIGISNVDSILKDALLGNPDLAVIKLIPPDILLDYFFKKITKTNIKSIGRVLLDLKIRESYILKCLQQHYSDFYENITMSNIIFYFYDIELLTEEIILKWHQRVEIETIKDDLKAFIKWLQE